MIHILSAAVGNTWYLPFENNFILWFQGLAGKGSFLYYLMNFISMFGEEMILVGIVGLIYWGFDKRRGEKIGFMMISAVVFNPLIKGIVRRTRPFDSGVGIENFRDVDGYSFPSGHSSGSASTFVGTAVVYKDRKYKWLIACAVIIPVLVALSRTYLGAHYPTDVVCGLVLGVGIVFLVDFLYRVIPNKYWMYGGMLIIGIAGFFYCTESDFFTGYGILLGFVCGILFEEKVTKFDNTKVWWRIILRVLVGGGLFLGLNEVTKLVVGGIYPTYEQNVWFEHIFRALRYSVVVFLVIGVYPLLFAQAEKLWRKLKWIKEPNTATDNGQEDMETPTEKLTEKQ
ncbi:MAG: phosphatase PAP2 family protein [Clostridiales bacterium]|nr:phosphatase PAP2 family protein [Clostridiales bacterium]